MRLIRAAAMAVGMLLAQQAQAGSFVTLGGKPVEAPRSVVTLGAPAPTLALSAPEPAIPDRSIETAALPETAKGLRGLPEPAAAEAPDAPSLRPWPPAPSRSILALGEPLAFERVAEARPRRPLALPTVFRGGLAGDAYPVAASPAREAVTETQVTEKPVAKTPKKTQAATPQAEPQPVVAERREPAPLKRDGGDEAPAPAAPPTVPATPPPTIRLE